MSIINYLVFEAATKQPARFRPKMYRRTIPKQRNVYAGQISSNLARQRAPGIANRKKFYRQQYLKMKAQEQRMFGSRAKALSKRR